MKWFEILIIIGAVFLVISPLLIHITKKKNGTLKCECGHNACSGSCENCNNVDRNKTMIIYTIEIFGMKCGMCESHINNLIRKNFKIINVKSSRKRNMTTIKTNVLLKVTYIRKMISQLGYKVGEIKFEVLSVT